MVTTSPIEIEIPDDKISKGKKWRHSQVMLKLPEGWVIDWQWTPGGFMPKVNEFNNAIMVGIRSPVNTKKDSDNT